MFLNKCLKDLLQPFMNCIKMYTLEELGGGLDGYMMRLGIQCVLLRNKVSFWSHRDEVTK